MSLFTYVNESEYETLETKFKWQRSDEHRAKLSIALKGKMSGDANPMFGRKHSEESRAKMSKAQKINQSGSNNAMFGKNHTEESRAKMSAAKIGKKRSAETRAKMSKHMTQERMRELQIARGMLLRFHTPYGVFDKSQDAAVAEGLKNGCTIRRRCHSEKYPDYFIEKLDK